MAALNLLVDMNGVGPASWIDETQGHLLISAKEATGKVVASRLLNAPAITNHLTASHDLVIFAGDTEHPRTPVRSPWGANLAFLRGRGH
jgi:hypothetical protein